MKENRPLVEVSVDLMVILKFLLKVKVEEGVFGFMWLRIGPEGGFNEHCH
jgi:hypothetical protein